MAEESTDVRLARLEERDKGRDEAVKLQATEYERRLNALNHAHEQAQARNAEYLPRDNFEQTVQAWSEWRQTVETRLTSQPSPEQLEARLKTLEVGHQAVASEYVSQEKYEDKLHAEAQAREIALQRVDERFDDYVKRADQRQREVDLLLQAQGTAQEEAKRAAGAATQAAKDAAHEAIRVSDQQVQDQARKNNYKIGAGSLVLAALVVFMNLIDKF